MTAGFGGTLSPVRFESQNYGIARFTAIFGEMQPSFSATQTVWRLLKRNEGEFLCGTDCLAEEAVWR